MSEQSKIRFRCQKCGKGMSIAAQYAGKKGKCKCGAVVQVPNTSEFDKKASSHPKGIQKATPGPPPQKETSPAKPRLPRFCIYCGKPLVPQIKQDGKKIRCHACKKVQKTINDGPPEENTISSNEQKEISI